MGCSSFTIAQIINTAIIWASTRETLSSGVCEQHRRRPSCATAQSDQRLFIRFLERIICKLAAGEISIFKLVSIAEETGLKHSSFSHNEAHMIPNNLVFSEKIPKKKDNASGFSSFLRHGKGIFSYNAINPHMPNVLFDRGFINFFGIRVSRQSRRVI